MKITRFTFCILLAAIILGGCSTPKPTPDPLAGWLPFYGKVDQAVVDDYQGYIQKLSPEEKKYLGPAPVDSFEDGAGQHAITIRIGLNGTTWLHVLIYDKDDNRIKTIKYAAGHYAS